MSSIARICTCDGPGPEGQHRSWCAWHSVGSADDDLLMLRATDRVAVMSSRRGKGVITADAVRHVAGRALQLCTAIQEEAPVRTRRLSELAQHLRHAALKIDQINTRRAFMLTSGESIHPMAETRFAEMVVRLERLLNEMEKD